MQFNVRQGKRGRFAFATLDDGSSKIEVSIWADVFEKYRSLLKKGQVLVVEGMIEKDEYSNFAKYKMIADKILTFDQARHEYVKNIKIDIENMSPDTFFEIFAIRMDIQAWTLTHRFSDKGRQ